MLADVLIGSLVMLAVTVSICAWLYTLPFPPYWSTHADFDQADREDDGDARPNVFVEDCSPVMHSSLFSDHLSSDLGDLPGILVNPATGLFMEPGGAIDVGGNPYGFDGFH